MKTNVNTTKLMTVRKSTKTVDCNNSSPKCNVCQFHLNYKNKNIYKNHHKHHDKNNNNIEN